MSTDVSRQILPETVSLREVLQRMNEGVSGIVLLVDASGRLTGIYTDGDARRAVLQTDNLDRPAAEYMNRSFTTASRESSQEERLRMLDDRIRHLPIVDEIGRPLEVLSWTEIWRLPLVEPSLGGNELKYVSDCIRTNWISSQGSYVTRFEKDFSDYHGGLEAIAVSSGTTALHLALVALGIGPGDEVIVPNLTFGATANAVIHAGAVPVLTDVHPDDWTLDPEDVVRRLTPRTRAILPVHLYGVSARMDELDGIAKQHDLFLIEDCAESLGTRYRGRLSGTIGDASAFSFFANKTITTGEGGMILVKCQEVADRVRLLRDHGMCKDRRYWHEEPGYNYRITNMQSAIGCAQMERLDSFLAHRRHLGETYDKGLGELPGIRLQRFGPERTSSYWLYSVVLEEAFGMGRDELMRELLREGIESRPVFYPLDVQPAYRPYAQDPGRPVSTDIAHRGISLPTSNHMQVSEAERVCETLSQIYTRGRFPRA